ncbi:MAG TPA: hypothetical protein VGP22_08425, partial [Albitalea sp.]|nr:hypothetical protein [Albitalea sp.]
MALAALAAALGSLLDDMLPEVEPVVPLDGLVVDVPLLEVPLLVVDEVPLAPVVASSRRWQAVSEASAINAMVLAWAILSAFMAFLPKGRERVHR